MPRKHLTISLRECIIYAWMFFMAFGIAGLIWYGAFIEDPKYSFVYTGIGIFLLFICISRIVRKEIEHAQANKDSDDRSRIPWI